MGRPKEIYNQDCSLFARLRKAYKLTMSALYPYKNKQNVNLALAIIDETIIVAAKCYYIFERSDCSSFFDPNSNLVVYSKCNNAILCKCRSTHNYC